MYTISLRELFTIGYDAKTFDLKYVIQLRETRVYISDRCWYTLTSYIVHCTLYNGRGLSTQRDDMRTFLSVIDSIRNDVPQTRSAFPNSRFLSFGWRHEIRQRLQRDCRGSTTTHLVKYRIPLMHQILFHNCGRVQGGKNYQSSNTFEWRFSSLRILDNELASSRC